jgi:hypothetical protein
MINNYQVVRNNGRITVDGYTLAYDIERIVSLRCYGREVATGYRALYWFDVLTEGVDVYDLRERMMRENYGSIMFSDREYGPDDIVHDEHDVSNTELEWWHSESNEAAIVDGMGYREMPVDKKGRVIADHDALYDYFNRYHSAMDEYGDIDR